MSRKLIHILLILLLLQFASCSKEDFSYEAEYASSLCCITRDLNEELFLMTDEGLKLYPTSSDPLLEFQEGSRVLVNYSIIEEQAPGLYASKTFRVKLFYIQSVLMLDVQLSDTLDAAATDPIWMEQKPWISGRYLNVHCRFKRGYSEVKHRIVLRSDSMVIVSGLKYLYLTLEHDARGDVQQYDASVYASVFWLRNPGIPSPDTLVLSLYEGADRKDYRVGLPPVE